VSKKVNEALYRFGSEAEVMFASTVATLGNNRIQEVMRTQRTSTQTSNEVLHQANKGVTINEIHNVYKPPRACSSNGRPQLPRFRGA